MKLLLGCLITTMAFGQVRHAGEELLDRVLALVGGRVITLSDARLAIDVTLVGIPGGADPVATALEQLINRELILVEVDRYSPGEPDAAAVQAELDRLRRGAGSPEALTTALAMTGVGEERLRDLARDNLRIEAYLEQRFAASAQPSDQDLATYLREHPNEFSAGSQPAALDEVRDRVAKRFAAERRRALVSEWVAGLRRRTEVTQLYLPASK